MHVHNTPYIHKAISHSFIHEHSRQGQLTLNIQASCKCLSLAGLTDAFKQW